MSEVELQRCLEAILMVVDEPVSELVLAQIIEVPTDEITAALISLAAKYEGEQHGFELRQVSGRNGANAGRSAMELSPNFSKKNDVV